MDGTIGIGIAIFAVLVIIGIVYGQRIQRYHGSGEGADSRTMQEFGTPAKSLYTTSKVFTLHHRIAVTDEQDNVLYNSESKVISIHDKTDITRADGSHVAHIERKLLTLREVHFITMADGTEFQLSNEILHIIKDVTNIIGLGWRLDGNMLQLNFVLRDENEEVIAVVGQKVFSVHDKYCIDIYKPEHEEKVVAILIALQHMIRDRENASSSSSDASSSSAS